VCLCSYQCAHHIRHASSPYTSSDILKGYSAAVASSVGMGLGLRKLCFNFTKNLKGGNLALSNALIAYVSVATAGFLNTFCMRMGEMEKGIKIYDKENNEIGISKNVHAKQSTRLRLLAFFFLCLPLLFQVCPCSFLI